MDTSNLPREQYLLRSIVVLVAVLAFQYLSRGATTPSIAVVVAIGFFATSVAVDRLERG